MTMPVAQTSSTAVAPHGAYDPYAAYGEQATASRTYVTFKNGEYLYGQEDEEIPLGTRFVANMTGLRVGWKRWFQGRVTDELLDLLVDCKPPKKRHELGDLDQALWEKDDRGQPRDPWQFTNELALKGLATGEAFIFATSSKGGIGAIGELCKQYGALYRQKPGMAPVIELSADSYQHRTYGKTYFPVLKLVDWVPDAPAEDGPAGPPEPPPHHSADPAPSVQTPPAQPPKAQRAKRTVF